MRNFTFIFTLLAFNATAQLTYQNDHYYQDPSWSGMLVGDTLYITDIAPPTPNSGNITSRKWYYRVYGSNGYVLNTSWVAQGPGTRTIVLPTSKADNFRDGFSIEKWEANYRWGNLMSTVNSMQEAVGIVETPNIDTVYQTDTVFMCSPVSDTVIINVPTSAYEVDWYNVQFGNLVPTSNNPSNVTIETSVLMTTNGVPVSAPVYASGAYIYFLVLKWQGMYFVQNIPYYVP